MSNLNKIKIIGEVGSNHMNDFETGKKLIDFCKITGCSFAKFQLWKTDDLYKGTKLYEDAKKYELGFDLAKKFFDYGKKIGIDVFFSVFYPEAIIFCESIGVKYYKVSNAFSVNKSIVDGCLNTNKPVIISFSEQHPMNTELLNDKRVIPLYTIPLYPPKYSDFNLDFLKKIIEYDGGYSNHYTDLFFSLLSIYFGAKWIELHIKLDGICEKSPDVICSLTPKQLKKFMIMKDKILE
jgi:sialic acid synthase SpsE